VTDLGGDSIDIEATAVATRLYPRTRDKFEPNVELAQPLLAKYNG
jgi:hypothetical protein